MVYAYSKGWHINYYKQVRPSAALASLRALRPAINGRPRCSILSIYRYLSLHKCAHRARSRLEFFMGRLVVLRIKFRFNPFFTNHESKE